MIYRGDGRRALTAAIQETNPARKTDKLVEAMLLQYNELEQGLNHLGPENFSDGGLDALAEKVADKLAARMKGAN